MVYCLSHLCHSVLYFNFWKLSVTFLRDLESVTRPVRLHAVNMRLSQEALAWISVMLQQRQLLFLSSVRRHGRYLRENEPWFLDYPQLLWDQGAKQKMLHLSQISASQLCLLLKEALLKRVLQPYHCAHYHPLFLTQALPCDPAWQEYMTQHMFSCL